MKDGSTYCVALIVDAATSSVQFWAAGVNCCSRGNFECDDAWDEKAHAGLVLRQHSWHPQCLAFSFFLGDCLCSLNSKCPCDDVSLDRGFRICDKRKNCCMAIWYFFPPADDNYVMVIFLRKTLELGNRFRLRTGFAIFVYLHACLTWSSAAILPHFLDMSTIKQQNKNGNMHITITVIDTMDGNVQI